MNRGLNRRALSAASIFLIVMALNIWAVPVGRAAHTYLRAVRRVSLNVVKQQDDRRAERKSGSYKSRLPAPVRFREASGQGLLVKAWINGAGPYTFVIDTGAGATVLSQRIAQESHIAIRSDRSIKVGGLSGVSVVAGREASLRSLAIGDRDNLLPAKGLAIVTDRLPPDVDGLLDPTEAYWPLGYSIDIRNSEIAAFDPRRTPLRLIDVPAGGTVVQWLHDTESRRPFVMLDNGRRALLDTGSGFGLAISESVGRAFGVVNDRGENREETRDLGGGRIKARRIAPVTVRIGTLVLRRVPTDLLSGVDSGAPVLLGRDALAPFRLTFDPLNRLIQFAPG